MFLQPNSPVLHLTPFRVRIVDWLWPVSGPHRYVSTITSYSFCMGMWISPLIFSLYIFITLQQSITHNTALRSSGHVFNNRQHLEVLRHELFIRLDLLWLIWTRYKRNNESYTLAVSGPWDCFELETCNCELEHLNLKMGIDRGMDGWMGLMAGYLCYVIFNHKFLIMVN